LKKLNRPPPVAAKLGVALVMLVALASSLQVLSVSTESFAESEDYPSSFEKRFEGLKKLLPERGIIGYKSDSGGGADYFLANYTLSPILVELGDGPQIYVMDRTRERATSAAPVHPGEYTVRRTPDATVYDFGGGLSLVERDSQ
jgi:hypothetical protein